MFHAFSNKHLHLSPYEDAMMGALRIVLDVVVLQFLAQSDAPHWFGTVEDGLVWLSPSWRPTTFTSQLAFAFYSLSGDDGTHGQFLHSPTTYVAWLSQSADIELAGMCQVLKRLPQRDTSQRMLRSRHFEHRRVPAVWKQDLVCRMQGSVVGHLGHYSDGEGSYSSEELEFA